MADVSGQSGRSAAWRAAVNEHRPWLRALVARRLGEPAQVDDLLHDVLVEAMARPVNGEPIRDVRAWLARVALRRVQQHRRSRGRQHNRETAVAANRNESQSWTPLDDILRAEQAGLLQRAMGELDDDDAELLRLKYVQQWSYQLIAAQFGWSWNAVAHRLRTARDRLRQRVRASDID